MESTDSQVVVSMAAPSTYKWLTADDAADYARVGVKTIYRAVSAKQLRAAKVGGRRELRFLVSWVDEWLISQTTIR